MVQRTFAFLCTLLVVGCSPASDLQDSFDDYQQRLARLLDTTAPASDGAVEQHQLPPARELAIPIPEVAIDLADLWSLRQCDIARLISERNSILGKVQRPLLRFEYESNLQREIESCRDTPALEVDNDLSLILEQISQLKRGHLSIQFHNMLVSEAEIRDLFKVGRLGSSAHSGYQNALKLLEQLTYMLERIEDPERVLTPEELAHLKSLLESNYGNHYIGYLLGSMQHMIGRLQQTSAFLVENQDKLTCQEGLPNQQAEYLKNVLMNVYGKRIQPQISDAYSRMARLQPLLQSLYARHADNTYFAQFSEQGALDNLRSATLAHSQSWQQILSTCGLAPSRS